MPGGRQSPPQRDDVDQGDSASAAWLLCEACGNWERGLASCPACGWHRTSRIPATQARAGAALRFLVETEIRSDGSWHVAALRSARLPGLSLEDGVLRCFRDLAGPLRHLLKPASNGRGALPGVAAWERFRDEAASLLGDRIHEGVLRAWPAPTTPSRTPAIVAIRCLVLDPEVEVPEAQPPWLYLVPFDTAAADAAAALDDSDVTLTCASSIGLGEGGDLLSVSITAPCELLVDEYAVACEANGEPRVVWRSACVAATYRDVPLALPTFRLPAEAMRGLADASNPGHGEVHVFVRGRHEAFVSALDLGGLPASDRVADLLLDLGSTTTKWALRFRADATIDEHDQDTESLVRAWGIPPYEKSELVADSTGSRWCEWLARALPALRYWVGREHGAFLGDVHVSLPTTLRLGVEALARSVQSRARADLVSAADEHLTCSGRIYLAPEHALLARHYLDVLRVLQDAAKAYAGRFEDREKRRATQASQRASWDSQDASLRKHKEKFFLVRWFSTKPKGPSGSRPTISHALSDPEAWMLDLIERPEQLDRVVLLDSGGLSLDVAALEIHRLVREISHSFDSCGGEDLSRRIGRGQSGPRGTRHKAQLALRWRDTENPADPQQREYIDATRALYEPDLRPLFDTLGARWKRPSACVVLLTGGGSRNPHLRDLVGELAAEAGLQPTVADAPYIQAMLGQARRFAEPLPELESPSVHRFEETQTWSERRERQPWARYDKFAVVGGMLVPDAEDA